MKKLIQTICFIAALTGCIATRPDPVWLPSVTPSSNQSTNIPQSTKNDPTVPFSTPEAAVLTLPSATPVPLPTLPVLDSDCLLGTWVVTNLPAAMSASLSQSQASMTLNDVDGQVFYEFDPSGAMRITFNELSAELNGTLDGREVTVEQFLNGSGTARYSVDALAEQLALSEFGGQGIQSSLAINGQVLAENQVPVWRAFSRGAFVDESGAVTVDEPDPQPTDAEQGDVAISRADADCSGDNLTLQAVEPAPGPAVILERVQ